MIDANKRAQIAYLQDLCQEEKDRADKAEALLADAPSPKQPDFRAQVFRAAERTNQRYGQWMPQQWLEIFVGEMMKEPE